MSTMTPAESWQKTYAILSLELENLNLLANDEGQAEDIRSTARADAKKLQGRLAGMTMIRQDALFGAKG